MIFTSATSTLGCTTSRIGRAVASTALLLAFATAPAMAQLDPTGASPAPMMMGEHGMMGHHHDNFMRAMHQLDLSDAQKTQLRSIVAQFKQAHPRGSRPSRDDMKAYHEQLVGVLTDEQKAKLKAEMGEEHGMMNQPGMMQGPGQPGMMSPGNMHPPDGGSDSNDSSSK